MSRVRQAVPPCPLCLQHSAQASAGPRERAAYDALKADLKDTITEEESPAAVSGASASIAMLQNKLTLRPSFAAHALSLRLR